MIRTSGYLLVLLLGAAVGYFGGREHLKYEMSSALESAASEFQNSLATAFNFSDTDTAIHSQTSDIDDDAIGREKATYIAENITLYEVDVRYRESMLNGNVPGILFKLRNDGERSLDKVEVTIYFKDDSGNIIAEEDYNPVFVSAYSFSGDSRPLRPGYIWQMERGKFYSADRVPDEWQEGDIEAIITDIEFSE